MCGAPVFRGHKERQTEFGLQAQQLKSFRASSHELRARFPHVSPRKAGSSRGSAVSLFQRNDGQSAGCPDGEHAFLASLHHHIGFDKGQPLSGAQNLCATVKHRS